MATTLGKPDPTPVAVRSSPPGWRDPRLWVGLAIVAVSVVAGVRLVGSADDSVRVWAAAQDLAPGTVLAPDDLVARSIRFGEPADGDRYLLVADELPADVQLARPVPGGDLVPRSALTRTGTTGLVTLPLALAPEQLPPDVGPGSRVDVWVVPDGADGGRSASATPVLENVVVVAAPTVEDALGTVSAGRQLVLGVPEGEREAVAVLLAAARDDRVRVLGRG